VRRAPKTPKANSRILRELAFLTAAVVRTVATELLLVDVENTTFAQEDIESTIGELNAETIEIAISDSASQLLTILQDNRHLRPRID